MAVPAAATQLQRSARALPPQLQPLVQLRWRHCRQLSQRQAPCALFTGIVQGKATVRSVRRQGEFASLAISFPPGTADGVQIGASIAINGTCLTVTCISDSKDGTRKLLGFDVISETLRATNLGSLEMNSSVNFERSARMGDEIGGHHVSGHVHTTALLREADQSDPNNRRLTFQVPRQWMKYLLPKGFVAVDGCSLTVGEVGEDSFSVYLIPETLRVTVLGQRRIGDAVNIEIDSQTQAIVDTVEALLPRYLSNGTAQQLKQPRQNNPISAAMDMMRQ